MQEFRNNKLKWPPCVYLTNTGKNRYTFGDWVYFRKKCEIYPQNCIFLGMEHDFFSIYPKGLFLAKNAKKNGYITLKNACLYPIPGFWNVPPATTGTIKGVPGNKSGLSKAYPATDWDYQRRTRQQTGSTKRGNPGNKPGVPNAGIPGNISENIEAGIFSRKGNWL